MGFRFITIKSTAQLKYSAGYLIVIKDDQLTKYHLNEIDTLLIESQSINLSTFLLCKLIENKVNIIICDSKHHPSGIVNSIYGSYDCSAKINQQINWRKPFVEKLWKEIIKHKIKFQAINLINYNQEAAAVTINNYIKTIEDDDKTNREGLAAKIYFRYIFGKGFTREDETAINYNLDFVYSILLAYFSRGIVSKGYLTQIGIKHIGKSNNFNLASDLMEPFRPIVDKLIIDNIDIMKDDLDKNTLYQIHDMKIFIDNKFQFLPTAIDIYLNSIFKAIDQENLDEVIFPDYG